MDILTLQGPRRFTASSSQRVEELAVPSGLPARASIAGCLTSRRQPEEWRASLERLGQERSRVEELPTHIPALVEASLFEELASAIVQTIWIGDAGQGRQWVDCIVLTSPHHGFGAAHAGGQAYVVQLKRTTPGRGAGTSEDGVSETREPVVPDTEHTYTVEQMARAWGAIGRPVTEDDVPLSVEPDDYPLF